MREWTIGSEFIDHEEPLARDYREERNIYLIEYGVEESTYGECVYLMKYEIDYPYIKSDTDEPLGKTTDFENYVQKVDERVKFYEDPVEGGSKVKIAFHREEGYTQKASIYRGRRKTHELRLIGEDTFGVIESHLRIFAEEVMYGCLSSELERDSRRKKKYSTPQITVPFDVFKRIILGTYHSDYYSGEVQDMKTEIVNQA